jgi:metal-responsive CopG/Arc/MetJ family transcriptional regulator
MQKRVRLTVSLSADLVRRIDRGRKRGTPRSRVVEELLEEAEQQRARLDLDREIRAYYAQPESAEEEALSRALSRLARKLVIDEPPPRRRR